ncbi:MAG: oligoendopeptidase F [Clostridiales bacterium]|jgi:oligoendopeptidase F|nr:oligoendopeptidase F [Clostridiales bacterium]
MKRSEVQAADKWRLEAMFESDAAWEEEFKAFKKRVGRLKGFSGGLNTEDRIFDCLTLSDALDVTLERLYCYARMRRDENGVADKYVSMADRASMALTDYAALAAFISPELCALDEAFLRKLIDDPRFADFSYGLSELARKKRYILSEREEKILALSGGALDMFQDVFGKLDYIDLKFPKVRTGDSRVQLTHGSYALLLQNRDPAVRKAAFTGIYKSYLALINTVAATYAGSVKADNFYAKARGYESSLSKALYNENVPVAVYENLLDAVGGNLRYVHDYVALRKRLLGGEKLHVYDLYVPLVENAELAMDYPAAYELVKEGLAPLGAEYRALLETAYRDGWIDVYETENKRSGAYSWGAYGTHPYVLLNYTKTTHDVFTVAHELGHAMHSYYSDAALPHAKAQYTIFVAEVASTVNEVLLLKHLLAATEDKKLKKYLLSYYLDMFRTTLFRQTMFAEFEKAAHEADADGRPLTPKSLSDIYYKLNKKYYGPALTHDSLIRYEWARIPHFYTAFYVYKYATGITAAVNIAAAILKEGEPAVDRYKAFLKSGGSDSPYELLKLTGVDLGEKTPYETAMNEFKNTLDTLKSMS